MELIGHLVHSVMVGKPLLCEKHSLCLLSSELAWAFRGRVNFAAAPGKVQSTVHMIDLTYLQAGMTSHLIHLQYTWIHAGIVATEHLMLPPQEFMSQHRSRGIKLINSQSNWWMISWWRIGEARERSTMIGLGPNQPCVREPNLQGNAWKLAPAPFSQPKLEKVQWLDGNQWLHHTNKL